ncbi:MAG: hypothetical protein JNL38_30450 [Myxococcales bacterium]|nr:hypothetical protein [Myxococcales bacterium]
MRARVAAAFGLALAVGYELASPPASPPPAPPAAVIAPASTMTARAPSVADGEVTVAAGGLRFGFRVRGARPVARLGTDREARYPAALPGGDLSVRASARGVEDFVYFAHKPPLDRIVYEIDVSAVAGLRYVEGALELLDASGTPRVRMAPPFVDARDGERIPVAATLHGCAYDASAAPPWGRPVVAPGASRCELEVAIDLPASRFPATLDPAWVSATEMLTGRSYHDAVGLKDDRVYVVSGHRLPGPGAEMFDPASATWATVSGIVAPRYFARAVRLDDGSVLSAGGTDVSLNARYTDAELYDPKTGRTTVTFPLPVPRSGHSLTALPGGGAIVIGGFTGDDVSASAAIFDPKSGWRAVASMASPRSHHGAGLLPDGRVIVAGGEKCCVALPYEALRTTEIYDPVADSWSPGPALGAARYDHTLDALPDGRVLVTGGASLFFEDGLLGSVEVLDAARTTWSLLGSMREPRTLHRSTPLPNGKVLITGTSAKTFAPASVTLTETVDPGRGVIAGAGDTREYRTGHSATLLADGRVLVAGGGGFAPPLRTAELFGTKLGEPCGPGDCATGACVGGVCCASEAACVADAGLVDAGAGLDAAGATDASAGAPPPEAAPADTSYHACRAARGPARGAAGAAPVALVALVALAALRRRGRR